MEGKQIGLIIVSIIGILVGIALLTGSIAPSIGLMTGTVNAVNVTYTAPAVNSTIDLTGQELIGTPVVTNSTNVTGLVASGNYTIAEGISATTGYKSVQYTSLDNSAFAGKSINISYTYGADGYVDSSGGRAFASLIILFFSMGIMFVALRPTLESWGYLNFLNR